MTTTDVLFSSDEKQVEITRFREWSRYTTHPFQPIPRLVPQNQTKTFQTHQLLRDPANGLLQLLVGDDDRGYALLAAATGETRSSWQADGSAVVRDEETGSLLGD